MILNYLIILVFSIITSLGLIIILSKIFYKFNILDNPKKY